MVQKKRNIVDELAMPTSEAVADFEFDIPKLQFTPKDIDLSSTAISSLPVETPAPGTKEAIIERAIMVFGDHTKAHGWLNTRNDALGMSPKEMLDREDGPCHVARILNHIEYGGVV